MLAYLSINVFNFREIVATIEINKGVSSEHLLREGALDSSTFLLLSEPPRTLTFTSPPVKVDPSAILVVP